MAHEFDRISKSLPNLLSNKNVKKRENSACDRCGDQDQKDLRNSCPGRYRSHKLHVTAAHSANDHQDVKEAAAHQDTEQTTTQPGPARQAKTQQQSGQKSAISEPVGYSPSAHVR